MTLGVQMKVVQKTLLPLILFFMVLIGASSFIFFLNDAKNKQFKLVENNLLQEAVAHFDNMLITRLWNAQHGGLFVEEHEGIEPNPYLKNNFILGKDGKKLIKINPAWMTRQISEISNTKSKYYYKITSLNPLNPHNVADEFETKALKYFEKDPNAKHYYSFQESDGIKKRFDFMGPLKVEPACMQCHAHQGYKVGDLRGGIRVSIPSDNYNETIQFIQDNTKKTQSYVLLGAIVMFFIMMYFVVNNLRYQSKVEFLNATLEQKVLDRTQDLKNLNESLEYKIKEAVEQNKKQENILANQEKFVSMGKMISMIAHQWRQPIAVISMGINNILVDLELGEKNSREFQEELKTISKQTEFLSNTISDFQKFLELNVEYTFVSLKSVVQDAVSAEKWDILNSNIKVSLSIEKNIPDIVSSKDELLQVLHNIIKNAIEALIQNSIKEKMIYVEVRQDDFFVYASIKDNAGGVKQEIVDKIFDPYFTTKEEFNGSGLGLYMSKLMVEKHLQGTLTLQNVEDGACFTVGLPKELKKS